MNQNDLKAAQAAFIDARESLYRLEAIWQHLFTSLASLEKRVEEMEKRHDRMPAHQNRKGEFV